MRKCKHTKIQLCVVEHPKEFYDRIFPKHEEYVTIHSRGFESIYSKTMGEGEYDRDQIEGIIRICCQGKTVYRRCIATCGINGGEIGLGYRTQCQLGIVKMKACEKKGKNENVPVTVCVSSSNWFSFLWHHYDSTIRWPFRIAIIALMISILSVLFAILCL